MTSDLTTLSNQAEQAGPEETRELLEEAWRLLFPVPTPADEPEWLGHGLREPLYHHWYVRKCDFFRLLDINTPEAFMAAAMMLAPKGKLWGLYYDPRLTRGYVSDADGFGQIHTLAETPALALLSAISQAAQEKV